MIKYRIYCTDDSPLNGDARNPVNQAADITIIGDQALAEAVYEAAKKHLGEKFGGDISISLCSENTVTTSQTIKEMPSNGWAREEAKKKGTLG